MYAFSWKFDTRWTAWMVMGLVVGVTLTFLWVYALALNAESIMRVWQFIAMPFILGFGTARNVRKALERPPPDEAFVLVEAR